jgi:hypothetical protein
MFPVTHQNRLHELNKGQDKVVNVKELRLALLEAPVQQKRGTGGQGELCVLP